MVERGQLPKAYLRLGPNADEHPDLHALVTMMLEANRQSERGRFKSLEKLRLLLGRKRFQAAVERKDLVRLPDGRWYLDGWDEWQEGDWTVGERMTRVRAKKRNGVTAGDTDGSSLKRDPPSKTQCVKALETENPPSPPARAGGPTNGHGHGPPTKADQEATVRRLVAYWRWLGTFDPKAPGGRVDEPRTAPDDRNVRTWRRGLRDGRFNEREARKSIAVRVRKDLTDYGVNVWDIEPWPPEEAAEGRSD